MNLKRDRFYSDPGSPIHQLYVAKVAPDGTIDLVEDGVEDTDAYIQSFKDSTDMSVILARVGAGELDLLYKRPGSYGDFTQLPKTYAEALQLQIDSTNLFNSLPVSVKQKFDNDSSKFFAQSGTKEWFDNIRDVIPAEVQKTIYPPVADISPVIESEVKE